VKKIIVLHKAIQDKNLDQFTRFKHFLQEKAEVQFIPFQNHALNFNEIATAIQQHAPDFAITLGGDGTFLDGMRYLYSQSIPILGINTGRLGFLTSFSLTESEQLLPGILQNDFFIEERTLIELTAPVNFFKDCNKALNEFTIQKTDSSSMITIHTYVNDELLNTYWADGLIVATPTGSTAYSLSCGGPIVMPESGNFIITPIAPHNLNVRPIVIPDEVTIKLKIESRSEHILIALDSYSQIVSDTTEIILQKAPGKLQIIRPSSYTFFTTLRNKLMWGVDKRN
jgi:NAD+ kinase